MGAAQLAVELKRPDAHLATLSELGAIEFQRGRFAVAVSTLERAIELGPGRVLAGLVRRIDKRIKVISVGDPQSVARVNEFLS